MLYLLPWPLQILSCHFRSALSSVLKISILKSKNSLESIERHTELNFCPLPYALIYTYQHWIWCLYKFQHSKGRRKRKHRWSVCVQKRSWMMPLPAKPSRSQVGVPGHPACPKCHRNESGHTLVHGARFCKPTKRAWGCQSQALNLYGVLSPWELGPHAEPAGTEASPSCGHSEGAGGVQASHWDMLGKRLLLKSYPLLGAQSSISRLRGSQSVRPGFTACNSHLC